MNLVRGGEVWRTAVVWALDFPLFSLLLDAPSHVSAIHIAKLGKITIHEPMIYTAPCVMFFVAGRFIPWGRGGGWVLEISSFVGYSETGFHIGMDGNFVCLWRRHNCNWSLPFCADLLIYEINYWVFKGSDQWEGRGCRRSPNHYMLMGEVVLDVFCHFNGLTSCMNM